jgi:hypothetical protein
MSKYVSSVIENQFVVSPDLMLYMKFVPKFGNIVELRTDAEQQNMGTSGVGR